MSDGKTILVDVSRCTGCRGCPGLQAVERAARYRYRADRFLPEPARYERRYLQDRPVPRRRHENGKPYWNFFTDMPPLRELRRACSPPMRGP